MHKKKMVLWIVLLASVLSFVSSQEIILDIKTDKQIYLPGENVTFTVILFDGSNPVKESIALIFADVAQRKISEQTAVSNEPSTFLISNEAPSGYWSITAKYKEKEVKRFFSVGEREEVEFRIVGDKLIIKNAGNTPYTKTIQILIGDKVITQKQNIRVGEQKEIRLIAPEGNYNIQVSDGTQTITQSNVFLSGTGKVIGALDEEIVNNPPSVIGGARDPDEEDRFVFSRQFSASFIFIGAVAVLGILLFFERIMRRKANAHIQRNIGKIVAQHK